MKNLRVTARLEETDRTKIERLISEGKYPSLSQVIRLSLKEFLKDVSMESR